MALLCNMKPVGGLPDPRGLLRSSIPTQVIAEANTEVHKAVGAADKGKHGPYKRYSSTLCAEIAKYACQHGVAAIARHYSNLKLKRKLSKSTVNGLTCNVAIFCAV